MEKVCGEVELWGINCKGVGCVDVEKWTCGVQHLSLSFPHTVSIVIKLFLSFCL